MLAGSLPSPSVLVSWDLPGQGGTGQNGAGRDGCSHSVLIRGRATARPPVRAGRFSSLENSSSRGGPSPGTPPRLERCQLSEEDCHRRTSDRGALARRHGSYLRCRCDMKDATRRRSRVTGGALACMLRPFDVDEAGSPSGLHHRHTANPRRPAIRELWPLRRAIGRPAPDLLIVVDQHAAAPRLGRQSLMRG